LSGPADIAKAFLKRNKVWSSDCRLSLYRDILSAARVCNKSDLYWKVSVYFPPHIVRFCHLQDDEENLQKMYEGFESSEMPSDICLYLNKSCWKYSFWEKQIQEIVSFWRKHKMFVDDANFLFENLDQLHNFEERFKVVKYALNEKNLRKRTIFNFSSEFEDFQMEKYLLQHKVFYRMPWSDGKSELTEELSCPGLFGTADMYCFWDDYMKALSLKALIANRLKKQNIYFVEGYPTAETLKNDIGFVLNKGMHTYVKETLDPNQIYTIYKFTDLKDKAIDFGLNNEMTTIWLFGCEYFTINDIIELLGVLKAFPCKLTMQFFGHYDTVHFTANKFNLLDWFSLSVLRDRVIRKIPQSSEIIPEEFLLKDADKSIKEAANDKDVIRVAFSKKEKNIETELIYMLHDKHKTGFYKSVGQDVGTVLISKGMQVVPNKNVVTNKTSCVGFVTDISYSTTQSLSSVPNHWFNHKGKDLKVHVRSISSHEIFAPKDLVPSPVVSFSEITYPLQKVALVGKDWPTWAVEAFRKYLCTETLYITDSFQMAEKDWRFYPEESVYTNILNTEL